MMQWIMRVYVHSSDGTMRLNLLFLQLSFPLSFFLPQSLARLPQSRLLHPNNNEQNVLVENMASATLSCFLCSFFCSFNNIFASNFRTRSFYRPARLEERNTTLTVDDARRIILLTDCWRESLILLSCCSLTRSMMARSLSFCRMQLARAMYMNDGLPLRSASSSGRGRTRH